MNDITYSYAILLPHAIERRVLLHETSAGWELPHFTRHERDFWQNVAHVNTGVHEMLGARVTTLRCAAIDYRPQHEQVYKFYALENHDPLWPPPPGYRWFDQHAIDSLQFASASERSAIHEWFSWMYDEHATDRAPWYRPGWFDEAASWMRARLAEASIELIGPIEQIRSWQRSAILRVATTEGMVYFKAVPRFFAHEPRLTHALSAADPDHFPRPLAVDSRRGCLLMRDFGGITLDKIGDLATWEAALRDFAQVQIDSITHLALLQKMGIATRSIEQLRRQSAELFADRAAALPGLPAGLSNADRAALDALQPRIGALLDELASYRLPLTLEHGDFWPGQVIHTARGNVFIDWSDSSIAHPFFSLLLFLEEVEDYFPDEDDVRLRLRDAYLGPWRRHSGNIDIEHAFELAQPLGALHHALTYYRFVLPHMESKWEMELMVPFYLKMLLRLAG
jgi:hypothetical protein